MNTAFAVVTAKDVEAFAELHALVYNTLHDMTGGRCPLPRRDFEGWPPHKGATTE